MTTIQNLKKDYPWIQTPLVVGAPMRLIALADMAVEISNAGMHTHVFFQPHILQKSKNTQPNSPLQAE
jgi:hypothetical protein